MPATTSTTSRTVKIEKKEMLKLAEHIVKQKEGEFEAEAFRDRYEEALIEIIKKKEANQPVKKVAERPSAPATSSI